MNPGSRPAVIAVRPMEGRTGSTLLLQLLATSPAVVFDTRYPAEYRFLSYVARMAEQMTEPFDDARHLGVTPFFFGPAPGWGPVPFASDVIDVPALRTPLLAAMWDVVAAELTRQHPSARYYAEKLAVPVEPLVAAGIDLRIIDLVRDPRDVLASIRAFTAGGVDGFGRRPDQPEEEYLEAFLAAFAAGLTGIEHPPASVEHTIVRYEDLATDLAATADRLGEWLGVSFDAEAVLAQRDGYRHHMTSAAVADSIGRWRHDLTPAEADCIAEVLGPSLVPLGYDLAPSRPRCLPRAVLATGRLTLTPLTVADADEMVAVYTDERMYEFTGGAPPSLAELRTRYGYLVEGWSAEGAEQWCNWVIRATGSPAAIGVAQATVAPDLAVAAVAWEVGTAHQGHGYASEAACAMVDWLLAAGVRRITAAIHPDHEASAKVARRAGLTPTAEVDDGEIVWERRPA